MDYDYELDYLLNLELSDDDESVNSSTKNSFQSPRESENLTPYLDQRPGSNNFSDFKRDFNKAGSLPKHAKNGVMSDKKYSQLQVNREQLTSFSEDEKSQVSKEIYKEKNELKIINKEIEKYYQEKEEQSDQEEETQNDNNSIQSFSLSFSMNNKVLRQSVLNKLKTIEFVVRDFYDVTKNLMQRQGNYNFTLQKSITFGFGGSQYIVIADISGIIVFLNLYRKSIEILKDKNQNDASFATAIEFSKDLNYLYIGYFNGKIKIYDVMNLVEVYEIQVFTKKVQQITSIKGAEFIAHDNSLNLIYFTLQKNIFLFYDLVNESILFFDKKVINQIDSCEVQSNSQEILSLVCIENRYIQVYQFAPVKRNCYVVKNDTNEYLIQVNFNKKVYTEEQVIYFTAQFLDKIKVFQLLKIDGNYTAYQILTFEIEQKDQFFLQWLNDNTIFLLPRKMDEITIIAFPFIAKLKKNDVKLQDNFAIVDDQTYFTMQKREKLENFNFDISDDCYRNNEYFRIMKDKVNQRSISIIDFRGRILEIQLGKWKQFFEKEFKEYTLKNFLEKFWEVYVGNFCFFNDYIFDQQTRQRIMGMFLNEKILVQSESNFSIIENHLNIIMRIYVKMDNYFYIYSDLKNLFIKKDKFYVFQNSLEKLVKQNKIKKMPVELVKQIAETYINRNQKLLIRSLIINLEFHGEDLDNIIHFCLKYNLLVSLIALCMHTQPPQFGKLINILVQQVIEKGQNKQQSILFNEVLTGKNKKEIDLNPTEIALWFFYQFLQKKLFDKIIQQSHYEMYFETFFIIYFQSGTAYEICQKSVKIFCIILLEYFKDENISFLKERQHFYSIDEINQFIDSYKENTQQFKSEEQEYLNQLILVIFDLQDILKPIKDPYGFMKEFLQYYIHHENLLFQNKINLIYRFISKYILGFEILQRDDIMEILLKIYVKGFQINLNLLKMICDLYIQTNNYQKAFQALGLNYTNQMKSFIFSYLSRNIQDQKFQQQFLQYLSYFLLQGVTETFQILSELHEIPYQTIKVELDQVPTIKKQFFEFMLQEQNQQIQDIKYMKEYVEVLILLENENDLMKVLNQRFELLNDPCILQILLKTNFNQCIAYFYEQNKSFTIAFKYYWILYQLYHDLKKEEKVEIYLQKCISQIFIDDTFIHQIKQIAQRKPKYENTDLYQILDGKNIWDYLNEIFNFCTNIDHAYCYNFRIKILSKIMQTIDSKEQFQFFYKNIHVNENDFLVASKYLESQQEFYEQVLEVLFSQNINKIQQYMGKGNHGGETCSICQRISIKEFDANNLIIIKPKCNHYYHFYCSTVIIKQLKQYKRSVYQFYNENTQFQTCLVCTGIDRMFQTRKIKNQDENDKITQGVLKMFDQIGNVIQPVKSISYGVKDYFDSIISFGLINNNENQQPRAQNQQQQQQVQIQKPVEFQDWYINQKQEKLDQNKQTVFNFKSQQNKFVDFDQLKFVILYIYKIQYQNKIDKQKNRKHYLNFFKISSTSCLTSLKIVDFQLYVFLAKFGLFEYILNSLL